MNKAGSLIYHSDQTQVETGEIERTYQAHPVDLIFKPDGDRLMVQYGDKELIGMVLVGVNDETVVGKSLPNLRQTVLDYLNEPRYSPIRLRFARPRLSTNDRIMLGSMFHS